MFNNYVKVLPKVCLLVSITSKWPTIMCFGCQLAPKKLITNAKISCPPFDIHKSKLVIAKWNFIKVGKTYYYFSFPIKPINNSWKNYVLEGKKSLGHKWILNCFNQILSTTCKQRWFLILKNPRSSKNCFGCGSSFLKG
jgi:hypothetical protein